MHLVKNSFLEKEISKQAYSTTSKYKISQKHDFKKYQANFDLCG